MSDLLQRSQKKHPQPLLPVNNQSARALVQHAVHQVRHFFRRVKKRRRRYSNSIQAPHNAWHPWHRVDLCVPLSPLPREGMELMLQLPEICARSWPSVVRQAPALYFSSSSHQSLRNVAEEEDLRVLAPTNHTLLPLGFSKDFETFCGSLFCLGFARVIRRCTSTLIRSQSLHISSTSTVLRLFHVGSRQRGQDR